MMTPSERVAYKLPKEADKTLFDQMTSFLVDRTPEPEAMYDSVLGDEGQDREADLLDSDVNADTDNETQDRDSRRSTYKARRRTTHAAGLATMLDKSTEAMNTMADKVMGGTMQAMKVAAEIGAEALKETEVTRGHSLTRMGQQHKEASALIADSIKYMADRMAPGK